MTIHDGTVNSSAWRAADSLEVLLDLERRTVVVDVGANPIDGEPPYRPMLNAGRCEVIGFEPQAAALQALLRNKGPYERYFPHVLGDGAMHTLHVCRASGMTSLLEPDPLTLAVFGDYLHTLGEVLAQGPVQTRRLDELTEIPHLDFLKIDVQGSELAVFRGGTRKLAEAVAIQTEVSFVPLYRKQPTLADVDAELRAHGFIPHAFEAIKKWPIAPCVVNGYSRKPPNQLLEADLVYVRDFSKADTLTDEQLKQLSMIAHYCYGSYDLTLRCITLLNERGSLPPIQQAYLNSLTKLAG